MKAVFNGKYVKNGKLMYTYAVNGTTAEIENYKIVMAANANKTPEDWPCLENGKPLYYINVTGLLQRGETPESNIEIIPNREGTRYFVDNSAHEVQMFKEVKAAKIENLGRIFAERTLGIGVGNDTVKTTTANNTPAEVESDNSVEALMKNGLKAALVAEGNENLND